MRWRRRLQLAAVVVFLVAYAGLSHYGNSVAKTHDLGVGLALGPVLTVGLLLLWRGTHLWVALLGATAATLMLFLFAPLRIWSLFANFCVLPLIGLMFVAEYAVRRRALPQVPRRGILAAVRVYFANSP